MVVNNDEIRCQVEWSEDDDRYVGVTPRLPSLSCLADSPVEAFMGIRDLVVEAMGVFDEPDD